MVGLFTLLGALGLLSLHKGGKMAPEYMHFFKKPGVALHSFSNFSPR